MLLSVIIVNYNVKQFLENCLRSVEAAGAGVSMEIYVVDNNSTDGSLAYLTPLFPTVRFIANTNNPGFGKACNQGLSLATGRYVLFLNPDTVVPPDCFTKCLAAMQENHNIGALGVRMVDGDGVFLKESKRALPGAASALFKLFGLSTLFPNSKLFSKYNLGHLDEHQNHSVEVLCGAFMFIRKEVLDITGGFDEAFFMYGEDIDLSYRILKAGYINYYLANPPIIHYKGESTDKQSLKYVKAFYGAMIIFVDKHYTGFRHLFFKGLLYTGIGLRAGMALLRLRPNRTG